MKKTMNKKPAPKKLVKKPKRRHHERDDSIGELWGNTCVGEDFGDGGLGKFSLKKAVKAVAKPIAKAAPKIIPKAVTKAVAVVAKPVSKATSFVAKKTVGEVKAVASRVVPKNAGFGRTLRAVASVGLSETKAGKKVVAASTQVAKAIGLQKVEELIMKAMKWFKEQIEGIASKLKDKTFNTIISTVRKSVGLGEGGEDFAGLGAEGVDTKKMDQFILDRTKDFMLAKSPEMAVTTASTVATAQFAVGTAAATTAGAGAAPAASAAVPGATATLTAYFGNLAKEGATKVSKQVLDAKTGGKFSKIEKMYDTGGNLYSQGSKVLDKGVPDVSKISVPAIDTDKARRFAEEKARKESEERVAKAKRDAEERAYKARLDAEAKARSATQVAEKVQANIPKSIPSVLSVPSVPSIPKSPSIEDLKKSITPNLPRTDTVVSALMPKPKAETTVSTTQKDVLANASSNSTAVSKNESFAVKKEESVPLNSGLVLPSKEVSYEVDSKTDSFAAAKKA